MLPTPSTSHVDYNCIYEPAEDSYLVLDVLSSKSETEFLRHRFGTHKPSPLVVEVGTGSGVVLAFVTKYADQIFGRTDIATLGIDVNPFACQATGTTVTLATEADRRDATRSATFLDSVNGDLVTAIKRNSIDVVIFNPPYVPSESIPDVGCTSFEKRSFDRDSQLLYLSTDGGKDGMEVTDRLLAQLPLVLSEWGIAYILLCAQNRPAEVFDRIRSWSGGWHAEKVGSSGMKAGWERLSVIRISR